MLIIAITISTAQSKKMTSNVSTESIKLEDFKISVSVDSAEEIKSTFNVNDFRKMLSDIDINEKLSFEIVCNNKASKGTTSKISYKVDGSSKDVNSFLRSIKKIRKSAINYYQNKA